MKMSQVDRWRTLLDPLVDLYNVPSYVDEDPIQIPKSFKHRRDIEIAAFWTSIIAWGNRKSIINNARDLFQRMDNSPYEFISSFRPSDLKYFKSFKHRTFQFEDTAYFLKTLQRLILEYESLEDVFIPENRSEYPNIVPHLTVFYDRFFDDPEAPNRTRKHIANARKKSTCKRLAMFMRWMVRKDSRGVDLGIWTQIKPSQLIIPYDVHVAKMVDILNLSTRKTKDLIKVLEITDNLKKLDPEDPVKYDYALFCASINNLLK